MSISRRGFLGSLFALPAAIKAADAAPKIEPPVILPEPVKSVAKDSGDEWLLCCTVSMADFAEKPRLWSIGGDYKV